MLLPTSKFERLLGKGKPYIYIHTPKCGGSFVAKAFEKERRKCPTLVWPEAKGHKTYVEHRAIFANRGFDIHDNFIFSLVRNPWAWHVSWFNYIKNDYGGKHSGHVVEAELFQKFSFEDYVCWLHDPEAKRGPQGYITRQLHEWVTDENGNIAVDLVVKNEEISEKLETFFRQQGIILKLPHKRVNVSTQGDYRRYYTDNLAERIAVKHSRDIELFGYSFSAS